MKLGGKVDYYCMPMIRTLLIRVELPHLDSTPTSSRLVIVIVANLSQTKKLVKNYFLELSLWLRYHLAFVRREYTEGVRSCISIDSRRVELEMWERIGF